MCRLARVLILLAALPSCMASTKVTPGADLQSHPFSASKRDLEAIGASFYCPVQYPSTWTTVLTFPFYAVDLPISFVADTVLLPYDIVTDNPRPMNAPAYDQLDCTSRKPSVF